MLSGVHQRHHHSEACRCGGRTTRSLATGPPTLLPRSSVEYHSIPRARDRREGPQGNGPGTSDRQIPPFGTCVLSLRHCYTHGRWLDALQEPTVTPLTQNVLVTYAAKRCFFIRFILHRCLARALFHCSTPQLLPTILTLLPCNCRPGLDRIG